MHQRYMSQGLLALALSLLLAACGSSTDVTVSLTAENEGDPLPTAQTRMLTADVVGAEDDQVSWEAEAGELDVSGTGAVYTAPASAGSYTITVTSDVDPEASASIEVDVEAGVQLWSRQFGTNDTDYGYAVVTDEAGNVYVAGSTRGPLFATMSGFTDNFVVKYDAEGNRVWTKQFGSSGHNSVNSIAVGNDGNVYVAGNAWEELFAPHQGGVDAIVAAYDPSGVEMWSDQFGVTEGDSANGIAVDADGNVYLTGYTQGDLFDSSEGAHDVFVAKYDPNGTQVWGEQRGTAFIESGAEVIVEESGVYAVGSTDGDLFGTSNGAADVFVIKLDHDGNEIWSEQYGTDGVDDAYAAAPARGGGIHFAGETGGDFFADNEGGSEAFVATVGENGGLEGGWQMSAAEEALGLATDSDGNIVLAGHTYDSAYADNAGGQDLFVTKLDPEGNEIWGKQLGTAFDDEALTVTIDASGNVVTAGTSEGDLFGSGAGATDVVAIKHSP